MPSSVSSMATPYAQPHFAGALRVKEVVVNQSSFIGEGGQFKSGEILFSENSPQFKQPIPDEKLRDMELIGAIEDYYMKQLNPKAQEPLTVSAQFHLPHMTTKKNEAGPAIVVAHGEDMSQDGLALERFADRFVSAKNSLVQKIVSELCSIAPHIADPLIALSLEESSHETLLDSIEPNKTFKDEDGGKRKNVFYDVFTKYKEESKAYFERLSELRKKGGNDLRKVFVNIDAEGNITVDQDEQLPPEVKQKKSFWKFW